jgi:predicted nucleic acid-binding protein
VTAVVVDSSVALSWCFDDEASTGTEAVLDLVSRAGAIVPNLWHLELANVLLRAERRGRNIPEGITARLEYLRRLPIMTDAETAGRAWREVLALARVEGLTTYDAAYLELAVRHGLPLATKDAALAAAAKRTGVSVLPN